MNTLLTYLYRDADNYKRFGEVVFSNPDGLPLAEAEARIVARLYGHELFIAAQVGVPDLFLYQGERPTEADHCWHEYGGLQETDNPPTDPRTLLEFVLAVEAVHVWHPFAPSAPEPLTPRVRWRLAVAAGETELGFAEWAMRESHQHDYVFSRYCGAQVCTECNDHRGLVRCYCGWAASGGDGRAELREWGETLEEEEY